MTTFMDRFVGWNLDFDGDLYGRDERERLRWYEGIAVASQVQTILVPWAAAALAWWLGKPVLIPLGVVLAALLIPLGLTAIYVAGKRVDATPRQWSAKRLLLSTLAGLPYVVFLVGAAYHWFGPEDDTWRSSAIGAVVGLGVGIVIQGYKTRQIRRRDAVLVGDED